MKKGFTLVELLAVIVLIGVTITIVAVKVEENIKKADKLSYNNQIETVESAAIIFANEYDDELLTFNDPLKKVDNISITTLINKGFVDENKIKDLSETGYVVIADISGEIKARYVETIENVIFIKGDSNISIKQGSSYQEYGAVVAIQSTGLIELTNSNITSNINSSVIGEYEVTYSYPSTTSIIRKVSVIS